MSLPRLAPYAVSLTADTQRMREEQRVRQKMAERQRRRELKARETLRRQVIEMAIEEARQMERPRDVTIQLEQQKKTLAAMGAAHADERHALLRGSLYRRFYEPTTEEREQREENWHRRRSEHRLQRDARLAQIQVCANCSRPVCSRSSRVPLNDAKPCVRLPILFSCRPSRTRGPTRLPWPVSGSCMAPGSALVNGSSRSPPRPRRPLCTRRSARHERDSGESPVYVVNCFSLWLCPRPRRTAHVPGEMNVHGLLFCDVLQDVRGLTMTHALYVYSCIGEEH